MKKTMKGTAAMFAIEKGRPSGAFPKTRTVQAFHAGNRGARSILTGRAGGFP